MARVYFRVLHHIQEFLDALKLFVACHSILVNSLFLERPSVSVTILPWSCGTVNIGQYDTVWDCQKCHIIRIIYQQMLSRIRLSFLAKQRVILSHCHIIRHLEQSHHPEIKWIGKIAVLTRQKVQSPLDEPPPPCFAMCADFPTAAIELHLHG